MRQRGVILDISLIILLLTIYFEFDPEKNEVGVDFDIQDVNKLGFKDLADN